MLTAGRVNDDGGEDSSPCDNPGPVCHRVYADDTAVCMLILESAGALYRQSVHS